MRGTLADGTPVSAQNVITPLDDDAISYLAQKRVKGGEKLPDRGPIKLIRIKEDKQKQSP